MSLLNKLLAALLGVSLLAGAGVGVYAAYEHTKVQDAAIQAAQKAAAAATANALQAQKDATAANASLAALTASQNQARATQAAASASLASAAAAYPAAASTVVPDAIWDAIYGAPNATK